MQSRLYRDWRIKVKLMSKHNLVCQGYVCYYDDNAKEMKYGDGSDKVMGMIGVK